MSELAADFIRDQAGLWWFLGVKAFKFEQSYAKPIFRAFLPSHDFIDEGNTEADKKH